MKRSLAIFAIIAVALVVYVLTNQREPNKSNQIELAAQTSNAGGVTVTVMPLNLSADSQNWDFQITLDTHTISLDEDLTVITRLIDDKGNVYKPIAWEGDPPGGHHRQGTLKFARLVPQPKSVNLKISRLGGIAERNFEWELPTPN